jgi:Ca2+-binding EF-hand superfamily protein
MLREQHAETSGQENLQARFKTFDKDGDGDLSREAGLGPKTK